jgi:hypothetical protein
LHIEEQAAEISVPTWSKIIAPVVALAILGYLYCAYTQFIA